MKTIQQELTSNNLSSNESTDVAQNRPLWRLMSAWHYALLVVHARKEEDSTGAKAVFMETAGLETPLNTYLDDGRWTVYHTVWQLADVTA